MMQRAAHRMELRFVACQISDQRVDQRSRLTYTYRDRNVQLPNAWVFANKELINPMQLTELFSLW